MSNQISKVKISIAAKKDILDWSHGEVISPETINYKTFVPERGGLFCEQIFGPVKDFACACGKYKKIRHKGHVCDRCGVEVTLSSVRRERFGHIILNAPVVHIWFFKINPSVLSAILEITSKKLEEIIYFVSYVVTDPGTTNLEYKQTIDQESSRLTFLEILNRFKQDGVLEEDDKELVDEYIELLESDFMMYSFEEIAEVITKYSGAKFSIGGIAIKTLLAQIDIDEEIKRITEELKTSTSRTNRLMQRYDQLISFKRSDNSLNSMILDILPVLPPALRPIIPLDSGRFSSSDINDLYRRIIIRNMRLKRAEEMMAPPLIVNNERRMLQEAVDAYLDNTRKAKPAVTQNNRPLVSLSEILKGKKGRLRRHMLGKRVDYSGRSVIVTNPNLKLYQCGLPNEMALKLFRPFVINYLLANNYGDNIKLIEKMIAEEAAVVWKALRHVVKERPVILNRAPTLHMGSFQAFEVVLVNGKAIELNSLVTTPFNADFDGDQMSVHLPLSENAVKEARALMLGSLNILSPRNGAPIISPTQDIVLGIYQLTNERKFQKDRQLLFFSSLKDIQKQLLLKMVGLNEIILFDAAILGNKISENLHQNNLFLVTTPGKLLFNQIFKDNIPYINHEISDLTTYHPSTDLIVLTKNILKENKDEILKFKTVDEIKEFLANRPLSKPVNSSSLSWLVEYLYFNFAEATAPYLDKIKELGFKYSTKTGISLGHDDLNFWGGSSERVRLTMIDDFKTKEIIKANKKVTYVQECYDHGFLTGDKRHEHVIKIWTDVNKHLQKFISELISSEKYRHHSLCVMINSGARGSVGTITQLSAMRGLMTNPKGDIIELPVTSSFKDGLSVSEYSISNHGARKGKIDTSLKTADTGYLTRRLVDGAHDLTITEEDCKTIEGFEVTAIINPHTNFLVVPLYDRIVGRYTAEKVFSEEGNVICKNDILITPSIAQKIIDAGVKSVFIRSVLSCNAFTGLCAKCYGIDLTRNTLIKKGAAIGIIAAQSIGEPSTQLTMRTFHSGGIASASDITQGLPRIKEIFDVIKPKGNSAIVASLDGEIIDIEEAGQIYKIVLKRNWIDKKTEKSEIIKIKTDYQAQLLVKKGDQIVAGQKLTEGSIELNSLLLYGGLVKTQNYILDEVQQIFRLQGIVISDKHIEVIMKKMMENVVIYSKGDSNFVEGRLITWKEFNEVNAELIAEKKEPAYGRPIIIGLKKAALERYSFLSAASFQDTARVLVRAASQSKQDHLFGLKENVLVGNKIPVGTGLMTDEEIQNLKTQDNY